MHTNFTQPPYTTKLCCCFMGVRTATCKSASSVIASGRLGAWAASPFLNWSSSPR